VGGLGLEEFCRDRGIRFDDAWRAEIDRLVRRAAYTIISGKGATYYGVGSALARIVDAVLGDRRSVLTVCTPQRSVAGVPDVTVSLPQVVGGAGVIEALPLALPADEQAALGRSAGVVRAAISGLDSSDSA
jgi:L-lactate dehydrogenase